MSATAPLFIIVAGGGDSVGQHTHCSQAILRVVPLFFSTANFFSHPDLFVLFLSRFTILVKIFACYMSPLVKKYASRVAKKFATWLKIRSLRSSAVGLWALREYRKKSRALFLLFMSHPAIPAYRARAELKKNRFSGTVPGPTMFLYKTLV